MAEKRVLFTKRTDNPKLKILIAKCAERGVKVTVRGHSFHGPTTWVKPSDVGKAWDVLGLPVRYLDATGTWKEAAFDDVPDVCTSIEFL